jgi:CDP-2,3-bis-(O-geranylgeranyl)-sn-glycerol synthase
MFTGILSILYLFLPAMVANIVPVLADHDNFLRPLNKPLDGRLDWQGKRIFGDHKTVRGVVVGVIAGSLIGFLQGNLLLGIGMSIGALWGDACKSFVKRRFNIQPGTPWMPWDQVDFVIGAIIFTYPIAPQSFPHYFFAIVVIGIGSFISSYIGVRTGMKKSL